MGSKILYMLPALVLALLALILAVVGLSRDPEPVTITPSDAASQTDQEEAAPSYEYWVLRQPLNAGDTLGEDSLAVVTSPTQISDALGAGTISNEQYKTLFDYATGVYKGVDSEAKATASAFERLRDSMRSFADSLLIGDKTTLSPEATLAEMQRQYADAFKLAAGGDTAAASTFQSLANSILDQSLYSTRAEYNAAFGRTYGDARALEQLAVTRMQNPNAGVEKQLAEMQKRVEGLERILAQIAKHTADTSRGVEGLAIQS